MTNQDIIEITTVQVNKMTFAKMKKHMEVLTYTIAKHEGTELADSMKVALDTTKKIYESSKKKALNQWDAACKRN